MRNYAIEIDFIILSVPYSHSFSHSLFTCSCNNFVWRFLCIFAPHIPLYSLAAAQPTRSSTKYSIAPLLNSQLCNRAILLLTLHINFLRAKRSCVRNIGKPSIALRKSNTIIVCAIIIIDTSSSCLTTSNRKNTLLLLTNLTASQNAENISNLPPPCPRIIHVMSVSCHRTRTLRVHNATRRSALPFSVPQLSDVCVSLDRQDQP